MRFEIFYLKTKGTLNYKLNCAVIDKMADTENPLVVYDKNISTVVIDLKAESLPLTIIPDPKHSGGNLISSQKYLQIKLFKKMFYPYDFC
jgi:hypothetical protein